MPYDITTKDGITLRNIPDDIPADSPQIKARVQKIRSGEFKPVTAKENKPQEDVSLMDRVANFGRSAQAAIAAPLVGAAQRVGMDNAQNVSDAWREDMAAKSAKPGGMGGALIGGASVVAPAAMIPGANTVIGGGLVGALQGAMQPTAEGESAATNAGIGFGAGAAIPAAIRAGKTIRAMAIDPFTEAGRNRIGGNVLNRMAGDDAAGVSQRLATAQGATPGFIPSVAQAARNDGVSAFERTMRGINPQAFQQLDKEQKGALVDALLSIAKTPEERAAALELANESAKKLYGAALKESMPVTPDLVKLASRPSMRMAEARAKNLGEEIGAPFKATLADLRPQYVPIQGRPSVATTPAPYNPKDAAREYMGLPKEEVTTSIPNQRGELFEIPPVDSVPVRDMHTMKMGMDALMSDPTLGIGGREAAAINATRNKLVDLMPDAYQAARLSHIQMNKPVHQMDIGRELYNRFVPALADQGNLPFKTTADAYAKALLRNGDELARNTTGLKNATLEGTMTPEQLSLLRGVAKDAESKAAAEMGGKGVGSDTVQKIAMSNIAAEAGIPNWAANLMSVPGGWAKRAGDLLYGNSDEQVRQRLAYLLTHPQEAAQAMNSAGATPSAIADILKKIAQGSALSAPSAQKALAAE